MVLLPGCCSCGTCNQNSEPQSIEVDISIPEVYLWWESSSSVTYQFGSVSYTYYTKTAETLYVVPISGTYSLSKYGTGAGTFAYQEPRYVYVWDTFNNKAVKKYADGYMDVAGQGVHPYESELTVIGSVVSLSLVYYTRRAYFSKTDTSQINGSLVQSKSVMSSDSWADQVSAKDGFQDLNYGDNGNVWSVNDVFMIEYCDGQYGSVAGQRPSYRMGVSSGFSFYTFSHPNGCGLPESAATVAYMSRSGGGGTMTTNAPAGSMTLSGSHVTISAPYAIEIGEMRLVYPDGSHEKSFRTDRGATCW